MVRAALAATSFAAALLAAPVDAQERDAPDDEDADETQVRAELSRYEAESLARAVREIEGAAIDPEPEGKIVEEVILVRRDPLEHGDVEIPVPIPVIGGIPEILPKLNIFHGTTRPYVIEQELLVRRGDRWRARRIDETSRNLRDLRPLSLVLLAPLRGSAPDRVRLLVVTKDIWSLRLNTNVRYAGGELETFTVQPSEENVFGTHMAVGGQFTLEPEWYSLGGRYLIRRIGGSDLAGRIEANIVTNRETGDVEGSNGFFGYGAPLLRIDQPWGWSGRVSWRDEITRRNVGARVATFDSERTEEDDAIPFRYRTDLLAGGVSATRSFGHRHKHDLSLGIDVDRRRYRPLDLSGFDPAAAADFVQNELPVSDTRVGPSFTWRHYENHFLRTVDVDTLGLQEDYPLGLSLAAETYPALRVFQSTRNVLGWGAAAGYGLALDDGLLRAGVDFGVEVELGDSPRKEREARRALEPHECSGAVSDAAIDAEVLVVSPTIGGVVRVVGDVRLLHRMCNYLNRNVVLGGDTRLRGYPSATFRGPDLLTANVEVRTKPIVVGSIHLGAVAFADLGDAFDGFEDLQPKRSVGAGVRSLIPFLDRTVLRADFGWPLDPEALPRGAPRFDVIVTFRQAFPIPPRTAAESF